MTGKCLKSHLRSFPVVFVNVVLVLEGNLNGMIVDKSTKSLE